MKEKILKQQPLHQLQFQRQDLANYTPLLLHQQQHHVQPLQARSSMQGRKQLWLQAGRQRIHCTWSVVVPHHAAVAHLMRRSEMHNQAVQPGRCTKQLPAMGMPLGTVLLQKLQQPPQQHRPWWPVQLWHRYCRSCR
jgi:hypothetical protein